MIGLVVVTHAGLAKELVSAATMITGEIPLCEAVGLYPEDPADGLVERIGQSLGRVGVDGAIILTDMFGGTPSNTALSFLADGKVEVVTGVNLSMLVDFCSRRERQSLDQLTASLLKCGRESIINAGEFLRQ